MGNWYIKIFNSNKISFKKVITKALNLYIENLRKPTHVVFCLDFSGSMYGQGFSELTNAMDYILDYEKQVRIVYNFLKR